MKNILRVIKREFLEVLIPTCFFFIVFHIVAVTKTLMLASYEVTPTGVAVATVGALTVAKAVLIADKLPVICFPARFFYSLSYGKPPFMGFYVSSSVVLRN